MRAALGLFVLIGACHWAYGSEPASSSCVGRCGENDGSSGCQCNKSCESFKDCCPDYFSVCYSCQQRCGEAMKSSKPCQCNSACLDHHDCCPDYGTKCHGSTDAEVKALSEELYKLDQEYLSGDKIRFDPNPPGPLFTYVDPSIFTFATVSTFVELRDNYDPNTNVAEHDDDAEMAERRAFLDAVMNTKVMRRTEEFMKEHYLIDRPLREVIDEIFFTRYPRSQNTVGSSGFEHSFLGEIDDNIVKGFHNWISFYLEEQEGHTQYTKKFDEEDIGDDLQLFLFSFDWYDYTKSKSSMLIGSTPELELALYTVCFYHIPNEECTVSMNGVEYHIQTYVQKYNGKELVGTAYPDPI